MHANHGEICLNFEIVCCSFSFQSGLRLHLKLYLLVVYDQINFRSQLENLSLEDEIFNTTFTGHGGDEPEDKVDEGGDGVASTKNM